MSDDKSAKKENDKEQSKRFIEIAKEIEADETAEGADCAFKRIAGKRPMKTTK